MTPRRRRQGLSHKGPFHPAESPCQHDLHYSHEVDIAIIPWIDIVIFPGLAGENTLMKDSILIAVCTRRRPRMLRRCLESLISINPPENTDVTILAVENDEQAGMKQLVHELAGRSPFPLQHRQETRQGIPFARNRALDAAVEGGFDYLAFLDDDEWVEADWLNKLYGYAIEKGGKAVIHGHVVSEFPKEAPAHLIPLMQRKEKPTGTRLDSCATNNVIMPLAMVREFDLRFDERNPFAGGEDVLFFFSAHQHGVEIFECSEAVVHEEIPLNRMSLEWLAKRKYWMGIGQLKRDLQRGEKAGFILPKAFCSLVFRVPVVVLFAVLLNRGLFARHWLKLCKTAGTIGGLLGKESETYRTVDGG